MAVKPSVSPPNVDELPDQDETSKPKRPGHNSDRTVTIPQEHTLNDGAYDIEDEDLGIYEDTADCDGLSDVGEVPGEQENVKENENEDEDLFNDEENNVGINVSISRVQTTEGTTLEPNEPHTPSPSAGTRMKTNTPASFYTDWTELRTLENGKQSGVQASRAQTTDSVYREAMDLMTERCKSKTPGMHSTTRGGNGRQTPLVCVKDIPIGHFTPTAFFVNQKRPLPMPPLQAWRGFNGNVYFEPIKVQSAYTPPKDRLIADEERARSTDSFEPRYSVMSRHGIKRQMSILDKRAVFMTPSEPNVMKEELQWIVGMESTGSLCLAPGSRPETKHLQNKERLQKGSVAHRLFLARQQDVSNHNIPALLRGRNSSRPKTRSNTSSRPQTRHSFPSRLTNNTPEMSNTYGAMEKLPPLLNKGENYRWTPSASSGREFPRPPSNITRNSDNSQDTRSALVSVQ